jgi:predicted nucleotidyltransferase
MTDISHDFSQKPDLFPLAEVVQAVQMAATPLGIEFFLMGAAARDLLLLHAHGIEGRGTEDIDFAVMVGDWDAYESLRDALIKSGQFSARPGPALHRLRHRSGPPLDMIPFGGVERADRTIAWPPDKATVFDCFGAREAFDAGLLVKLPNGVVLRVASIPSMVILKAAAWNDRKHTQPGKDASDLLLFLRNYMNCGNLERAATQHRDLFDAPDFDYETAGARLLGRDIIGILDAAGLRRLMTILSGEADPEGELLLASQSGLVLERARRLIEALCDELAAGL